MVKQEKALTAVEVIITLALIAILASAAAISQMRNFDSLKLDAAAQKIASDLRYAQSLVMNRHPDSLINKAVGTSEGIVLVVFEDSLNRYRITPGHCSPSPAQITNPYTQTDFIVDFDDIPEFQGVSFDSSTLTASCSGGLSSCFPEGILAFIGPLGRPSNACCSNWPIAGLCVDLNKFNESPRLLQVMYRGRWRFINIEPVTGEILIQ